MRTVLFRAIPLIKEQVTLALESGVDGLVVSRADMPAVASLARCALVAVEDVVCLSLASKEDENAAAASLSAGKLVILEDGWEIIPVENLLAHTQKQAAKQKKTAPATAVNGLALSVISVEQSKLAAGILESGVSTLVVPPAGLGAIKGIVTSLKYEDTPLTLSEAEIISVAQVPMGHRVCVDTLSVLRPGQGMLVGNSAAFTFLVNAETGHNEYVASRPFRVNAGAVHGYVILPEDKTAYLEELRAGSHALAVDHTGATERIVVGRCKVEKRPMLHIRAKIGKEEGAVFLQNAETVCLVGPGGSSISVVALKAGDRVLCRTDKAGRHFGVRITEDISEA